MVSMYFQCSLLGFVVPDACICRVRSPSSPTTEPEPELADNWETAAFNSAISSA